MNYRDGVVSGRTHERPPAAPGKERLSGRTNGEQSHCGA
jgi:hypothetical protein